MSEKEAKPKFIDVKPSVYFFLLGLGLASYALGKKELV